MFRSIRLAMFSEQITARSAYQFETKFIMICHRASFERQADIYRLHPFPGITMCLKARGQTI